MFNALETMTLKARYSQALSALAVTVLAGAPLATLGAQQRTQDVTNVTRINVAIFRSPDKTSGVQAADAIRTRLAEEYPIKQLYVLPKQDVVNVLESSGFPTNEALTTADARALAQQLRTDAYVVGTLTRDSAGGYRVDANYVLTRNSDLVQPLPSFHVAKPDQVAGPVVRAFKDAHKQFADEKACYTAARANKWADAIAAGKKGIVDYPQATLSRICLANALSESKASPDSVLAVLNEVLRIDPRSRPALALASQIYKDKGDNDKYISTLLTLLSADPGNVRLQTQVANELAASRHPEQGVQIIRPALEANPGDPDLLKTMWLIALAAKDWKTATTSGEELVKIDTAAASADFFLRQSIAYAQDSLFQKAAETASRGVGKFANNADLLQAQVQYLTASGQSAQAVEAIRKVIAANPKTPGIYTTLAGLQVQMNQPDSAVASLQQALANGDSATTVAKYTVSVGGNLYKAATTSKDTADFRKAINVLEFANKTSVTPEGQYFLGVASLGLGTTYLTTAQAQSKEKGQQAAACRSSKAAQELFAAAQLNLPAGGKVDPATAGKLLTSLPQYMGYADQFVKALCK